MRNLSIRMLCVAVVLVACLSFNTIEASWFNKKLPKSMHKSESDCEKYVQAGAHQTKCGKSSSQCRVCCHFDLDRVNNRYNEKRYHIQNVLYVASTGECVCELCKKYVEDFNNAAYF